MCLKGFRFRFDLRRRLFQCEHRCLLLPYGGYFLCLHKPGYNAWTGARNPSLSPAPNINTPQHKILITPHCDMLKCIGSISY